MNLPLTPSSPNMWGMQALNRALFLDRDGILNEVVMRNGRTSSPRRWEEVKLYEGLDDGLARIREAGFHLILASNQPCVERGLVGQDFLEAYHHSLKIRYQLSAALYCPHADDDHWLRKPNPGMFQEAAQELQLALPYCYHLGDTVKDVEAAKNGGLTPILWDRPYNQKVDCAHRVRTVEEVEALVLNFPVAREA